MIHKRKKKNNKTKFNIIIVLIGFKICLGVLTIVAINGYDHFIFEVVDVVFFISRHK